jgi:2-polyprenyl-6-methoxyphenol hydroxylase-like FAD-dependent oxidoreductase
MAGFAETAARARETSNMDTTAKRLPVIVAGGGIGGVAAALALTRRGFDVTVLEQAAQLGEIGAGIQFGPNAFAALDALGVGPLARSRAVSVRVLPPRRRCRHLPR